MRTNDEYMTGDEKFLFYKIPKWLFEDESVKGELSVDAKLLYSILLDRANLSRKRGLIDDKGRVYIFYTVKQICETMHCASQKAEKLLKELDDIGLLVRKSQGKGKANILYVKVPSHDKNM